ncbi:unnamed protein product [Danaus chrysippus]|uniref:(African queen) hypothetical protein n=1 Tax=Danaus chrysippus TaxID=151541 RepID=A0A8J2QN30_9NEOP|nr:unnamed protein product [Danaus chrysippus]
MNSLNEPYDQNTPRRRRLGIKKSYKISQVSKINTSLIKSNPVNQRLNLTNNIRCESPPLPCNQVEYILGESADSSLSSEIPCSPGITDSCFIENINWDSFVHNKNDKDKNVDSANCSNVINTTVKEKHTQNDVCHLTSNTEKLFKDEIEESFDKINQSICHYNSTNVNASFFESKDSFLLDIRESDILAAEAEAKSIPVPKAKPVTNHEGFYGLPMIVKGLFKTYRNIEKFYDWQEECLNLQAIRDRRNLIYALPTSGGKTLVAEVLMLREVINRKHNAIFILPFVAIVQEKIWALAPFALQLEFLLEEYAGGKGHLPPKKRRKKNTIYIATIEKGLALVRSLIELNRLNEVGLIVVDELHLIGEAGRGSTLETLLTTVIFANKGIQIVGMSATIGNLPDLGHFLNAEIFEKQFRPVELKEYVKLGDELYRIREDMELVMDRKLAYDYSPAALSLDPDLLGGLVSEVVPSSSCLVFCPTKRNCENVAALLCQLQRKDMSQHRTEERVALQRSLYNEGAAPGLVRAAAAGVAFHHAGLSADERSLIENAFRSGVISVICCTSTLAAGVNLPARRVIVRAPLVGRQLLSMGSYKQMVGRAGRAGVCEDGESILIVSPREWPAVRARLSQGIPPALSSLKNSTDELLLSAVALNLCTDRKALKALLESTLMAIAPEEGSVDIDEVCKESISSLLKSEALQVVGREGHVEEDDLQLAVSTVGRAAVKGCLDLIRTKQLMKELEQASKGLVLMGCLHLLFLVTPQDVAIRPDYRHYYTLYSNLDEEGLQTAGVLGITEHNAVRMMTGKPITNVSESVLNRFYVSLMLRDLYRRMPVAAVSDKYNIPKGTISSLLSSAVALCSGAQRACVELGSWMYGTLFDELCSRLKHCGAPELEALMELPAVKKGRALQLHKAGFRRLEDIARASPEDLVAGVTHLSRTTAEHLISAARVLLIEKVENLRAEAEDVMDELNL